MFAKNTNITFKESVILLAFLGIILFLPLGVLQVFGHAWREVSWQDSTDIAMLEWTGAFFHVFLFLLLIEQYKASQRLMFVFLGGGFLGMGIMNFFYALSSPGTETAMWVRSFSLLLGSLCFSFSIPARKSKKSVDLAGVFIKYIVPIILLVALTTWVTISLHQLFPHLLTPKGNTTLFAKLFLMIPCAFFFFTALLWLHEYIKNKRRIDFLFAIILLIYAQMTLLMRVANTWGILWWLLHIVLFIDVLVACVYMLVLSVYRSLIWKLIFSLGLAFSFTVLIASGIIQSYSEKQFMKNFQINLHERHRRILLESESKFHFSLYALDTMQNDVQDFSVLNKADFYKRLRNYLEKKSVAWAPFEIEFGFFPENGDIMCFDQNTFSNKRKDFSVLEKFRDKALMGESGYEWSPFYYDYHQKGWVSTLVAPFVKNKIKGIFFVTTNVSQIRNPNILKLKNLSDQGGCVVFDRNNGKIICNFLPASYPRSSDGITEKNDLKSEPLLRKLVAAAIDINPDGRIMIVNMRGNKYFISAHLLQSVDWGVLNIVDIDNFPSQKGGARYFFIAVGMLTLLWGFVVLLLLLHRQLSSPLSKLLSATQQLEKGNFDINVDINDNTELGAISKAFNNMVWRLRELYSDLASTVQDRTDALEKVKKSDSAKVTFFQNISHELRTPMHGILSFARLGVKLDPHENPDKVKKYFNNINGSAERLMKMIDSIMDLAKLESGHMTFLFQPSHFLLPLHQIEDELKAAFIEKKIDFKVTAPKEHIVVVMDADMISRVFRNLLGNALKMSDPGSKIEVVIENTGKMVQVSVLDEGPGVPEDEINKIFDKFVQAGEGRKRGGTGLGLAVCREVINAHNGRIWAENRAVKGACFYFEIPINRTEEKE